MLDERATNGQHQRCPHREADTRQRQHSPGPASIGQRQRRAHRMAETGSYLLRAAAVASLALSLTAVFPRPASAVVVNASASQSPRTLRPGEQRAALFQLDLNNSSIVADTLRSLTLSNQTSGAGGQAELDLELGTLRLHLDDGDGVFEALQDAIVGTTAAAGDQVRFSGIHAPLPALTTTRFFLSADISTLARDGDHLDVSIQAAADIQMAFALSVSGTFPLSPAGDFPVDGMSAGQIILNPLPSGTVPAGTEQNLVLDVTLPPNGYAVDVLERLELVNLGTAQAGSDITALSLLRDDGDGSFEPASDRRLGTLAYVGGGRWLITGLTEAVSLGGVRLFTSTDLALFAMSGRTIRLALPTLPDVAVGMASANDGPIDQMVAQPNDLSISTANRVMLTPVALAPTAVRPGSAGALALDLVARNDYARVRTVVRLRITNASRGPGSSLELDREFQRVALRLDGNLDGVLGTPAEDPEVGAGVFNAGRVEFTGFTWTLAPGATAHAFVVADISTSLAADGDSLSVMIGGPFDVSCAESTAVAALWPIDSGARLAVDGMVAAQIGIGSAPQGTLGPDEGPALALELMVPSNGYQPDTLRAVRLTNQGTAVAADLAEVRLWRDGGDGVFQAGGDDQNLGPLTWNGSVWASGSLSVPLSTAGSRLWCAVVIGASPSDSVTIRLGLPVGGLDVSSGDDGPIDLPAGGGTVLLVSNAPLLSTLDLDPSEGVVGQTVTVRLAVRNRGAETVTGIAPSPLTATGSGSLALQTGPTPAAFDLAPAASDTFRWSLNAAAPGPVQLSARASGTGQGSGLPRSSLSVSSETHRVYDAAVRLDAAASQSMPVAVARGQAGVAPLSLTFSHPGGSETAPIRVDRLRIRLEDADGSGLVPNALLSRVVVERGATPIAQRDTLEGAGATVDLPLTSPVVISTGEQRTLVLRVDIADSTTAPNFRIAITDSASFAASELPSQRALPVQLQGATYPYRTALARIVASATRLDVGAVAGVEVRANRGQQDVPLLALTLESPGIDGVTSDVRLLALGLRVADTTGTTWSELAELFARVRARTATQTLAVRTVYPTDDSTLVLALTPALTIPVNTPVALELIADLAPTAPLIRLRARLADSASVDARDTNSGENVPARLLTHPVQGPWVRIEAPAESLRAQGAPRFGPRTRIGDSGVAALSATLRHPGEIGTGRLRLDTLVVLCRDDLRRDVAPASVLSRLSVRWQSTEVASVTGLPAAGGRVAIPLPVPALEAGDTARFELVADVAANAPEGFLELSIPAAGLVAFDVNVRTPVVAVPESGGELPLISGLTRLEVPARELRVDLEGRMPATLAADGRPIVAGIIRLRNPAAAGTDTILVDRLIVRAAARDFASRAVGAGATNVEAWLSDVRWSATGTLTPDSTTAFLEAPAPLSIAPGATVALELRFRTVTASPPPDFRLGVDSAGVVVRQPASALLHIQVRAEPGRTLPQWTEAGVFGGMSLASSLSNYPNPFAAGRGSTRFVYFLRTDARVTLRLATLDGDLVRTPLDRAPRPAGLHEDDVWDGRNGIGLVVRNGVYVAELVAEFGDGRRERVTRKVAVVR